MKKFLGTLISFVLIFALVGCGEKDTSSPNVSDNIQPTPIEQEFGLNEEYLSFMYMTKQYIDKECEDSGKYNKESGTIEYKNGLFVGYNQPSITEAPNSENIAQALVIKLEDLFYSCPDTVSFEQIKSVFTDAVTIYDEYSGKDIVIASYQGLVVFFNYGLNKNDYATVKNEPYEMYANNNVNNVNDDISGFYDDGDWSTMNIYSEGSSYYADAYVVRCLSGIYPLTKIDERTYSLEEPYYDIHKNYTPTIYHLIFDGNKLTLINKTYEDISEPWHFIKK